jgi:hypothetical protein
MGTAANLYTSRYTRTHSPERNLLEMLAGVAPATSASALGIKP